MGYVYIIRAEGTSYRKIGITERDPKFRLDAMQIGCPLELVLEYALETELFTEVERLLHVAFARYSVRGEWFEVDLDLIMERIDTLREFLVDEAFLIRVQPEERIIAADQGPTGPVDISKRPCPYCKNAIPNHNLRRHMRSCKEFYEVSA